jgi:hypothetical protein
MPPIAAKSFSGLKFSGLFGGLTFGKMAIEFAPK